MTDYEYDENLPYVVEQDGRVIARFEDFVRAEWAADFFETKVIDTTPKPRVPADAKFITWKVGDCRVRVGSRTGHHALRPWVDVGNGTGHALEDLPGVTPDTVFTVLDERKNDD